jgi:hypothetical protein
MDLSKYETIRVSINPYKVVLLGAIVTRDENDDIVDNDWEEITAEEAIQSIAGLAPVVVACPNPKDESSCYESSPVILIKT